MNKNSFFKMNVKTFFKIFIPVFIITFIASSLIHYYIIDAQPKVSDFEYAIIYYPDMKTSVEGYIDKYVVLQNDIMNVTLNGTTYVTSAKNVLIIKNKSLTLNKEDTDDNRENADTNY